MSEQSNEWLTEQITALRPWHHDIEINDEVSTGRVFSPDGRLHAKDNEAVSLISPRVWLFKRMSYICPDGMKGKRFLDCACNAGAYCFYAREQDAEFSVGFDVREHWIKQAKFVQEHRQIAPTDRIEFHVADLYDIKDYNFEPFDITYFSGLFYHLPDPVTGLKLAADLTKDVLVINTAAATQEDSLGLTMAKESTEKVMSGVYQLAWFPNGPQTMLHILKWLGFAQIKMTKDATNPESKRRRIEVIASREAGRLDEMPGEYLEVDHSFVTY